MKYTRTFGLAMLLALTVVVAANISESTYAQINMSTPSAGGVPKSTSGNKSSVITNVVIPSSKSFVQIF